MADSWDVWTHGVDVIVEKPAEVSRVGWGTVVRQPKNTSNWFHFPIPALTCIADDTSVVCRAFHFIAKLDEQVKITAVHAYFNGKQVAWCNVDLRGPIVNFDSSKHPMRAGKPGMAVKPFTGCAPRDDFGGGGLVLCVAAEFVGQGEICLHGAGARYDV